MDNIFPILKNIIFQLSSSSPIIIVSSMLSFSIFSATMEKWGFYAMWIFLITCIRYLFVSDSISLQQLTGLENSDICSKSIFKGKNLMYSTYIICFTLFYLMTPMIVISANNKGASMNYGVLFFFMAYLLFDMYVKHTNGCGMVFTSLTLGELLGGSILGAGISLMMYYLSLKKYLYIGESSSAEVCSLPSKSKFKCSVYKNGELISSQMRS